MAYVIPAPATPSVAVAGTSDRFPVRRILCVGRNYAAHAREMGKDPDREAPFFFMKPADTVVDDGAVVPYPQLTANLHYEMELVVALGAGGFEVEEADALGLVYGYAAGLDMTRRDLQTEAKDAGRPWDWGKGFDHSAPCAPIRRVAETGHPSTGAIRLAVNGVTRQDADLVELIWSVPEIIAIASRAMRLLPGDLIYTGTPAGVGAVKAGDRLHGEIAGVGTIDVTIGERLGA